VKKDTAIAIVKAWAILGWIQAGLLIFKAITLFGFSSFGFINFLERFGLTDSFVGGKALVMLVDVITAVLITVGIMFLVFALIYLIVGYGLWTHKNWARIVTIIMSAFGVLAILKLDLVSAVLGGIGLWLFAFEPTIAGLFGAKAFNVKK